MTRLVSVLILLALFLPAAEAQSQPVYVQLFTRSTDHVNLELTEQRIQRYVDLVERHRKEHPESGISLLCQLSGTVSEMLAQRNGANRLLDSILEARRKGLVETGYDGSDEPTPAVRPQPNFRRAKTPQQRWMARTEVIDWFLTEYKHFINGEPDLERAGGLKRMQEVFGEAAYINSATTELGGDPEVVHYLRRMNKRAVLSGLPEIQTYPARIMEGYRGGSKAFGEMMSPEPSCAPEVYWQESRLRLSDTSGAPVNIVRADSGPVEVAKYFAALDRSRVHVIRVEIGNPAIYLKPEFAKTYPSPLRYAYDTPKLPRLPSDAFQAPVEIEAAFGREAASIQWLAGEFLPANPGSRWVSSTDLIGMAHTSLGSEVTRHKLRRAAANLLERWNVIGNHPPEYALADGEYFSLADMFQMLSSALAVWHRTRSLPDAVHLTHLHGPWEMDVDQGPSVGSVSFAAVARVSSELAPAFSERDHQLIPENVIPAWITVDEVKLNSAQFLRLLTEAFLSPSTQERLRVRTCQMFHPPSMSLPTTRKTPDTGTDWTIKPARLQLSEVSGRASR